MILSIDQRIKPNDKTFVFDKDESRHLVKVLRKKENDIVHITNGIGDLFTATIILANEKKCTVTITDVKHYPPKKPFKLHIAIAPTKLNDRYEWFLEKAVEIGVDEITPIICKNSERKTIKIERYKKIVVSAIKQSLQYHLPVLNEALTLSQFLSKQNNAQKYIAHCEDENSKQYLHKIATPTDNILVLIGPEGDFTIQEINQTKKLGFIPVTLGENRLRTETAGVYVASLMSLI